MIHPESRWVHKREGYEVMIELDEDLVDKPPEGTKWHPAIAYRRTDMEESPKFVRFTDDFLAKFEPCSA